VRAPRIPCSFLLALSGLLACAPPPATTLQIVDGKLEETPYVSPSAYEHYLAGLIALQRGKDELAQSELEAALDYDPGSAYLHVRIAQVMMRRKNLAGAREHAADALRIDPDFPDALVLSARLEGASPRAEATLRRCLEKNPAHAPAHLLLAELLERRGAPREAQAVLERMAGKVARPAAAHSRIAMLCLRQLDYPCAAKQLALTLRERSDLDTLVKLAHVERSLGRLDEAVKLLREAFDRSGGHVSVASTLLELLEQHGKPREVDDLLGILEGAAEDNPEQVAELAELFVEARRPQRALALLDSQLRLDPAGAKAALLRTLRADVLGRLGRAKEAKDALRRELGGAAGLAASRRLARLLTREGAHGEASQVLRQALTRHGARDVGLLSQLAASLHAEGKVEAGLRVLRDARDGRPEERELLFALGSALERAGRWREAIATMREILKRRPADAPAHNFIGYTQVERGDDLAAAERSIRKALYLQPGEGYIIDSLGWLHFKQNRLAEAKQLLEMAVRLAPREPEVLGHLADVLAALRDVTGATALLRQAVAICEDRELRARLRKRLGELEKGRLGSR
jgi:tetratricopeptide (TPR) repeat protein